jgi:hypothetical protein
MHAHEANLSRDVPGECLNVASIQMERHNEQARTV